MISKLLKAYQKKGYKVFENDSKPFNLNLYGERDVNGHDVIGVFWKYNGLWSHIRVDGTTDPSNKYLINPINSKGTFILGEDQHKGMFRNGLHKGRTGLKQNKPVWGYRDDNRDVTLDLLPDSIDEGMFGINMHDMIGETSAGCQGAFDKGDHLLLMYITKEAEKIWGNSFTYTLLNKNDIDY